MTSVIQQKNGDEFLGLEECQKRWLKVDSFKIYFGSRIGIGGDMAVGEERRRNKGLQTFGMSS